LNNLSAKERTQDKTVTDTLETQIVERPMRADALRNYRKLVEAATEVFTESGPNASLEEIARRADVGVGTLYRHFPVREVLVEAVLDAHLETLLAKFNDLQRAPLSVESLGRQLWLYLEFSRNFGGMVAQQMANAVDRNPSWASCSLTVKAGFARLFEQAHAEGIVREEVNWPEVMRMLAGIAMALRTNMGRLSPEELDSNARLMFDITIAGIVAQR
jgi:AcrR family transcriptional regulator